MSNRFHNALAKFYHWYFGLNDFDNIFTHMTSQEKMNLHYFALRSKGKVFVEIGSYLGASSNYIASAVFDWRLWSSTSNQLSGKKFFCIDTWENDTMSEGNRDTFADFSKNTNRFPQITKIRARSVDAVEYIIKGNLKIDFLFIDGDHSYEGCLADWNAYRPLLSDNPIVIFHDCANNGAFPGVKKVVDELVKPYVIKEKTLPNMYIARLNFKN